MTDGKAQKNSAASGGEPSQLAARIQSTLVSNCVTQAQWENHIAECLHYRFQAAMIPAAWVKKTAEKLHGTGIKVASFIDLPLGTMTSSGKAYEAGRLVAEGAEEIDLMPNIGFLISGMEKEYFADIRGVVEAAGERPVKVMLELPLLNAQQKGTRRDTQCRGGSGVFEECEQRSSRSGKSGGDSFPAGAGAGKRSRESLGGNQDSSTCQGTAGSGSRSGGNECGGADSERAVWWQRTGTR